VKFEAGTPSIIQKEQTPKNSRITHERKKERKYKLWNPVSRPYQKHPQIGREINDIEHSPPDAMISVHAVNGGKHRDVQRY
jgi:hypothetical protein